MKINTKIRYGLLALVYIVKQKSDDFVRIKDIGKNQNIPIQYLEQILFKLKNEKIISGKRGPYGGYKLDKQPEEITLLEIYKILDDDDKIINCNQNETNKIICKEDSECNCGCVWGKMNKAMIDILKNTTLAEYVENEKLI